MKKIIYILFVCLFFSSCYVQNNNVNPKPKKRIIIEYKWSNGGYWNIYSPPYYKHHHFPKRPRGQKNVPRR